MKQFLLIFLIISLNSCFQKSILTKPINLQALSRPDTIDRKSSFHIFLINDSLYIEAKPLLLSKDSIVISALLKDATKKDSIYMRISYNYKGTTSKMQKKGRNDYHIKINNDSAAKTDSSAFFTIRKSKNFIIQPNVLNLLTGEIETELGEKYKLILLDDPTESEYYLTTIWLLSGPSLPSQFRQYEKDCEHVIPYKCKLGYETVMHANWYYLGLKKNVYCKCKEAN